MHKNQSAFMTVREVADYLNISPLTVYDLTRSGRLRHIRISARCIRISRSDLQAFIDLEALVCDANASVAA